MDEGGERFGAALVACLLERRPVRQPSLDHSERSERLPAQLFSISRVVGSECDTITADEDDGHSSEATIV